VASGADDRTAALAGGDSGADGFSHDRTETDAIIGRSGVKPAEPWSVENNINLANMDWAEFTRSVDGDSAHGLVQKGSRIA
jgi:hypothetical protein